ncbi:hypothetical protein L345_17538, partial [Ophiophagus hannah]
MPLPVPATEPAFTQSVWSVKIHLDLELIFLGPNIILSISWPLLLSKNWIHTHPSQILQSGQSRETKSPALHAGAEPDLKAHKVFARLHQAIATSPSPKQKFHRRAGCVWFFLPLTRFFSLPFPRRSTLEWSQLIPLQAETCSPMVLWSPPSEEQREGRNRSCLWKWWELHPWRLERKRASGHVQRARPYKSEAPTPPLGLSHPSLPTFACGGGRGAAGGLTSKSESVLRWMSQRQVAAAKGPYKPGSIPTRLEVDSAFHPPEHPDFLAPLYLRIVVIFVLVTPILSKATPGIQHPVLLATLQKEKDVEALEKVQRRATGMIKGLETKTYEEQPQGLGLAGPEEKGSRVDMIGAFQYLRGCPKEGGVKLLSKAPEGRTRSNGWKLIKERSNLE